MMRHVKSGNEILEEFFNELHELPGVDEDIADELFELYSKGDLTHRRLSNALLELREEENNDEDKDA